MMTIVWWAILALLLALGLLGCFVNKVPGPIAVVFALLIAILALEIDISWETFAIVLALAVVSMIASKVIVKLVKKLHDYSKRSSIGTTIGSIVGLGIIAGSFEADLTESIILICITAMVIVPFVLAFLLELTNKKGALEAFKSATSATGAYMADSMLKLIVFAYAIMVIFELEPFG